MDGVGTSEDIIARVLGGAEKEEALQIKERYDEKYGRSLVTDLEGELGGKRLRLPPARGVVQWRPGGW